MKLLYTDWSMNGLKAFELVLMSFSFVQNVFAELARSHCKLSQ